MAVDPRNPRQTGAQFVATTDPGTNLAAITASLGVGRGRETSLGRGLGHVLDASGAGAAFAMYSVLYAGRQAPAASGPSRPEGTTQPFDIIAVARERQDVRADMLAERLDRAVDALVACRLAGTDGSVAERRRVIFGMYEDAILTKAQVIRREELDPEQFYEELRSHRLRTKST